MMPRNVFQQLMRDARCRDTTVRTKAIGTWRVATIVPGSSEGETILLTGQTHCRRVDHRHHYIDVFDHNPSKSDNQYN